LESKERLIDIGYQNLFISYFLVGLMLLAWLMVMDRKKIGLYLNAFIGSRFTDQLERTDQDNFSRLNLISRFFYFINISLMLYKVYEIKEMTFIESQGVTLLGVILLSVVLWYLVKYLLVVGVGWIFDLVDLAKENVFYNQLNSIVLGLFLFPVLLLSHYQDIVSELVFVGFCSGLLLVGSLMRSRRLILLSFSRFGVALYYNILYICTLEILPLVVLIKLRVVKM
jgi:hypothetical protein